MVLAYAVYYLASSFISHAIYHLVVFVAISTI